VFRSTSSAVGAGQYRIAGKSDSRRRKQDDYLETKAAGELKTAGKSLGTRLAHLSATQGKTQAGKCSEIEATDLVQASPKWQAYHLGRTPLIHLRHKARHQQDNLPGTKAAQLL
jgi:hypothetical protein